MSTRRLTDADVATIMATYWQAHGLDPGHLRENAAIRLRWQVRLNGVGATKEETLEALMEIETPDFAGVDKHLELLVSRVKERHLRTQPSGWRGKPLTREPADPAFRAACRAFSAAMGKSDRLAMAEAILAMHELIPGISPGQLAKLRADRDRLAAETPIMPNAPGLRRSHAQGVVRVPPIPNAPEPASANVVAQARARKPITDPLVAAYLADGRGPEEARALAAMKRSQEKTQC